MVSVVLLANRKHLPTWRPQSRTRELQWEILAVVSTKGVMQNRMLPGGLLMTDSIGQSQDTHG